MHIKFTFTGCKINALGFAIRETLNFPNGHNVTIDRFILYFVYTNILARVTQTYGTYDVYLNGYIVVTTMEQYYKLFTAGGFWKKIKKQSRLRDNIQVHYIYIYIRQCAISRIFFSFIIFVQVSI